MTTTIFREKRLSREQETKRKIAAVLNKIYREVSIKGRPVKEISVVALVDELRQEEMVGTRLGKGLSHTNNELWLSVCDGHRLPTAEDVDRIAEAITSYNKGMLGELRKPQGGTCRADGHRARDREADGADRGRG